MSLNREEGGDWSPLHALGGLSWKELNGQE